MSYFATTHWSLVLSAGHGSVETATQALEKLCQTYWYPVYAFSRQLHDSHEDAQDLVQGFFADMIDKRFFTKARPEKGKFRSFLLTSFRLYRARHRERMAAQKRGGRTDFVALDDQQAQERFAQQARDPGLTPDQRFERDWALEILDQAHRRLALHYERAGKGDVFACLRGLLQSREDSSGYSAIARELGKTEAAIKMEVKRMKTSFGKQLRSVVEETVSEPGEVEEEVRYLFRILSY